MSELNDKVQWNEINSQGVKTHEKDLHLNFVVVERVKPYIKHTTWWY